MGVDEQGQRANVVKMLVAKDDMLYTRGLFGAQAEQASAYINGDSVVDDV